jgi:hypothetical protein
LLLYAPEILIEKRLRRNKNNTIKDYFGKNSQGINGRPGEGFQVRVETNTKSGGFPRVGEGGQAGL